MKDLTPSRPPTESSPPPPPIPPPVRNIVCSRQNRKAAAPAPDASPESANRTAAPARTQTMSPPSLGSTTHPSPPPSPAREIPVLPPPRRPGPKTPLAWSPPELVSPEKPGPQPPCTHSPASPKYRWPTGHKKLPPRFLVISNPMLLDQRHKIRRRVARQRRLGKMRIRRNKILRPTFGVSEIATASPEIRIFFPARSVCSITATRRPRLPASMAHINPAAPAPSINTSNLWTKRDLSGREYQSFKALH